MVACAPIGSHGCAAITSEADGKSTRHQGFPRFGISEVTASHLRSQAVKNRSDEETGAVITQVGIVKTDTISGRRLDDEHNILCSCKPSDK